MKYLAVLGRQPEISIAEIEAQFPEAEFWTGPAVAASPTVLDFRFRAVGDPPAPSPVHITRWQSTNSVLLLLLLLSHFSRVRLCATP